MATIYSEDFETDGNGTRYTTTPAEFNLGTSDYFTRTDGTDLGAAVAYTGVSGTFFFGAQDTDDNTNTGPGTVVVDIADIDISGFENLAFSGLFAEDDSSDGNEDWDTNSLVFVEASIDGGAFTKILQFASGGVTNSEPGLDTDFDGVADSTSLTAAFATFGAAIAGTGSSLDLRITVDNLNAGDEDIAFDLLQITGDAVASETTVLDETFDNDDAFTVSSGFFSDGTGDYLGINDPDGVNDDFGGDPVPTVLKNYTGNTGPFLTGMDLNGEGADLPVQIEWTGLNISGLTDLTFSGDFAEFFDSPGDIDAADFITVEVSIDGGPFETILDFRGADFSSGTFNGIFRQDTDNDGVGDGTALGDAFQTFLADIAGTGNTLDLRLSANVEAGDEDFAVDNFKIVGTSGGTPTPGVIVSAPNGVNIAEEGTTQVDYQISLTTTPTDPVFVTVTAPDGQTELSTDGGATYSSSVNVELTDSDEIGEVLVRAIDDAVDEANPHTGQLSFTVTSDDTDYAGFTIADRSVSIEDNDVSITLISEIQGDGDASPLVGETRTVEAIVTGIITDNDGTSQVGYFLQEEDADSDGNADTSEGIFVFSSTAVSVGDKLQVTGDVVEFGGLTELTGIDDETLIASGQPLPSVTQITLGLNENFEAFEGMRVQLVTGSEDPLTVIENFNLDRFGQITVAEGNQTQPTQIFDPDSQATEIADLAAANEANRIVVDDSSTDGSLSSYTLIDSGDGTPLDTSDTITEDGPTLRLGAELPEVEGVLDFRFGEFRIQVDSPLEVDPATNEGARPDEAPEVGGDLKVASFNVLNYFTTLDDGSGTGTGPNGDLDPRGATSEFDLGRQTTKIVAALLEIDADIIGLQEVENNGFGPDSAIAALVNALNDATAPGTYAFVDPGEDFVGTDAITTGLIYKPGAVTLNGSAIRVFEEASAATTFDLADELNPFASSDDQVGDFQRNRPALAATFEDEDGNEITVAVNHFKSKGDSNLEDVIADALNNPGAPANVDDLVAALRADPNFDQGDGQGFWNQVRADASAELADWLATNPTGATDPSNQLILGDLNAYAQEDPVTTLEDGGYTDLAQEFIGEDAYSFVFDGQRGTLDYGLASEDVLDNITDVAEWHINADEPDLLNYSTEFRDAAFFNEDFYAASDHDPLIIGLTLDEDVAPETVVASLHFRDERWREFVDYREDDVLVSTDRIRKFNRKIEVDEAGITLDADDGLRFSPEWLSTLGDGLGVSSARGDLFRFNQRKRLDDRETIEFELDETDRLGDALDAKFDFAETRGSGQVELEFFDDGELVDSILLDVENESVAYDLDGETTYDTVTIGVTGSLQVEIESASFTRLVEEENDLLLT